MGIMALDLCREERFARAFCYKREIHCQTGLANIAMYLLGPHRRANQAWHFASAHLKAFISNPEVRVNGEICFALYVG